MGRTARRGGTLRHGVQGGLSVHRAQAPLPAPACGQRSRVWGLRPLQAACGRAAHAAGFRGADSPAFGLWPLASESRRPGPLPGTCLEGREPLAGTTPRPLPAPAASTHCRPSPNPGFPSPCPHVAAACSVSPCQTGGAGSAGRDAGAPLPTPCFIQAFPRRAAEQAACGGAGRREDRGSGAEQAMQAAGLPGRKSGSCPWG